MIYEHRVRVPIETIDEDGHVNNVHFIRWMQETAALHTRSKGWSVERCRSLGATWVVRSHYVEYLQPAFADEEIAIQTWVADFRKIRSRRRYKFVRVKDQAVLARAETEWVFMDIETKKPRSIPIDFIQTFEAVPVEQEL
jgi:acyl-CoA thioester hydrolase